MNFSTLSSLNIPEGKVIKIQIGGKTIWQEKGEPLVNEFNYVSLGDSIAVGHRIDDNWETDYGWDAQYGIDGRTETTIVKNSYTYLIDKYLRGVYGDTNVKTTSFAVSGSKIKREPVDSRSLIDILDHSVVREKISKAHLVTICIGANTILEPALEVVEDYLINGTDLSPVEAKIENDLRDLANSNYPYSYKGLFDKLVAINPNAQYVFTTIYNPMRYLYIERGTWENDFKDGLFGTWINTIPQMSILGWEVDKEIKKYILDQPAFVNLRNRVAPLATWVERYIETGGVSSNGLAYLGLNQVIRNAIANYNNSNFAFTEVHELFDTVPDRQGAGELHYNDLVNVQITRGYDANDLNWYALWGNEEGATVEDKIRNYWVNAISRHISSSGLDVSGLANELMPPIVNDVLSPAFDPHPRADGHYVMYRSFADTLGWALLFTISYNANGGAGKMEAQKVLDVSIVNNVRKKIYSITNSNKFIAMPHYHFNGWISNDGKRYSQNEAIYVAVNISLTADWAIDTYILTVVQGAQNEYSLARLFSRDYNNRNLYISNLSRYLNSDKSTWDLPLKNTETFVVAYGEPIKMVVTGNVEKIISDGPKPNCSISQYNGSGYTEKVVNKVVEANFTMPDRNITIEYHFKSSANVLYSHSYWLGYIGDKDLNVTYSGRDS